MQGCERQTDTRDNRSYRNLVSVLDLDNIALALTSRLSSRG